MHVVFFTSAFPAAVGGVDMVMVRRARELARHDDVVVVVPTPWAPRPVTLAASRWAAYARLPREDRADGIPVLRPRYLQIPGSGALAGVAMALGALGTVRRLRAAGRADMLFAQSIVPDGLAVALLGQWTATPATCLGRGTDVHDVARSDLSRSCVHYTLRHSTAVAVVARQLATTLVGITDARPITILPNGVDLDRFVPGDRAVARSALGLDPSARIIAFVGRLVAGKGIETLLDALPRVADHHDVQLALIGTGPLAPVVEAHARRLGVADRVRLTGEVAHGDVPAWLRASDVFALPSVAEGFPNTVREALACGLPVVATPVGDLPRIITSEVGCLVPVGDPAALASALDRTLAVPWDAASIRRHVAGMTWEANARATHAFLDAARAAWSAHDSSSPLAAMR